MRDEDGPVSRAIDFFNVGIFRPCVAMLMLISCRAVPGGLVDYDRASSSKGKASCAAGRQADTHCHQAARDGQLRRVWQVHRHSSLG